MAIYDPDAPKDQEYPNPPRGIGGGQMLRPGNQPVRETEVSRELNQVSRDAREIKKLSEELVQRLASVISPKGEEIAKNPDTEPGVSTPLATNIREIHKELNSTKKALLFILQGIEL